jgi:hypothetical protein
MVGLCGLYPHVRWSWTYQSIAWFHNSFDEGFYAWSALNEFVSNRWLSSLVLRLLYYLCGANTQWMMIAADFILPAGATLAACYLVRPLFSHALSMGLGALFIVFAAECLGMRTNMLLEYRWFNDLQNELLRIGGGPGGFFLLGNLTSAFWVFRTPEPGISWILMFVVLGLGLRVVLDPVPNDRRSIVFISTCLLLGLGYLFCALSAGCAFLLFAVLAFRSHRRLALLIGGGGVITVASCIGLSLLGSGAGASFVFPSRKPAFMICFAACLITVGLTLVRWLSRRIRIEPGHLFALALALTPLVMANQHLVTGRMIYLLNFENFGFAHLAALAMLLAGGAHPALWPAIASPTPVRPHPSQILAHGARILAIVLVGWLVLHSQKLSFKQWSPSNRLARSYALALDSVPAGAAQIICSDFIATGIQPLLLNRRPNFLLALDDTYHRPISRLQNVETRPLNAEKHEAALFTYLATTGIDPQRLGERLKAVSNPQNPNWEDRALLGGFLYSHADFWTPLTHDRDAKLDWIAEQNNLVVRRYAHHLGRGAAYTTPLLLFQPLDKPFPLPPTGWQVEEIASNRGLPDLQLRALRFRRLGTP